MSRKSQRAGRPAHKTTKIMLDSSFLFIPLQFKVDIIEGLARTVNQRFELIILSSTLEELGKLSSSGPPKIRQQARAALGFAKKCKRIEVEKGKYESYDDVIVRTAVERGISVATNDKALRKRLRLVNVPVIYLRQKSYLTAEGAT